MRMYLSSWGIVIHDGVMEYKGTMQVRPETDINEGNGYSLDEIEEIKQLIVGEVWAKDDFDHSIILIPEGTTVTISKGETK